MTSYRIFEVDDVDCIFCKIVKGEIPSTKVYENDRVLAFKDIHPQAPVHIIVIPKEHIPDAEHINSENASILADIFLAIKEIAKLTGVNESGYRIINNCGKAAGQTVFHLHFHLLGGKSMSDSMV
ncbi:MAG: histidine triad nucleotide-binding protein [Clostridia bacterium]|jgi:histidine triad (HIT) family protein|nr:histidine triad nucleotide-binding protein [Clostridiaceae bacterium]